VRGLRRISYQIERARGIPMRLRARARSFGARLEWRVRSSLARLRLRSLTFAAAAGPFMVLTLGMSLPVAIVTSAPDAGSAPAARSASSASLRAGGPPERDVATLTLSAPPRWPNALPVELVARPVAAVSAPPPVEAVVQAAQPKPAAAEERAEAEVVEPAKPAEIADAPPPANLADDVADDAPAPAAPARPIQTAANPPASPAAPSAGTRTAAPLRSELPSLDCVIEPDLVVDLGSAVPGVIERIAVERSDVVEEGQVLVELEAGPEKAAVALAQARAVMNAEIRAQEASLGLGERQAARNEQLFANRAVSMDTKDTAATEAILARMRLDQARENKRLAELELGRAQAALAQRTLRSPVRGVVMERMMAPGELVSDQPILRVARIDPLKIEVIAPADLYGSVRSGMRAEVTPEAPGRGSFHAQVSVVDPVIDAASGTFGVSLSLPNPDHAVPGGLRCKVRFLPD
jgi:RND family efflux transporter MFP subunit